MRDAEGVFREEAVLILAPTAKDAAVCRKVLEEAGVECAPCRDVGDVCAGIDGGAGIALLSEEALTHESLELLRLAIRRQPAWSGADHGHTAAHPVPPELKSYSTHRVLRPALAGRSERGPIHEHRAL